MKYCQSCNKEYQEDLVYCEECGQKLVDQDAKITSSGKCPLCGTKCKSTQKFCSNCGASFTGGGGMGTIVVQSIFPPGWNVSLQIKEQTYYIKVPYVSRPKPLVVNLPADSYHFVFCCAACHIDKTQTLDITLKNHDVVNIICKMEYIGSGLQRRAKFVVTTT